MSAETGRPWRRAAGVVKRSFGIVWYHDGPPASSGSAGLTVMLAKSTTTPGHRPTPANGNRVCQTCTRHLRCRGCPIFPTGLMALLLSSALPVNNTTPCTRLHKQQHLQQTLPQYHRGRVFAQEDVTEVSAMAPGVYMQRESTHLPGQR